MEEIKIEKKARLDDVVDLLIQEREKGNKVFVIFDDVKLYSDTVTLDSAYQEVCGCDKKTFDYQYDGACAFNGMKEMFALSKENVLNNVKWSKLLFLTKNGKIYCPLAEEYIKNMGKYSNYCKEDKKDHWNKHIRELVYEAGIIEDNDYLRYLMIYELAGEIMKAISDGKSLKELKDITDNANCNELTSFYIGDVVANYSPSGLDYYQKIALHYNNEKTTQK